MKKTNLQLKMVQIKKKQGFLSKRKNFAIFVQQQNDNLYEARKEDWYKKI